MFETKIRNEDGEYCLVAAWQTKYWEYLELMVHLFFYEERIVRNVSVAKDGSTEWFVIEMRKIVKVV